MLLFFAPLHTGVLYAHVRMPVRSILNVLKAGPVRRRSGGSWRDRIFLLGLLGSAGEKLSGCGVISGQDGKRPDFDVRCSPEADDMMSR